MVSQFTGTQDLIEQKHVIKSAHSVINKARRAIRQYQQVIAEKPKLIEMKNRTAHPEETKRPQRKGRSKNVVAFRLDTSKARSSRKLRDRVG